MDSVAYRQARETLDSACAQGASSLHERALHAAGRKKEMARAASPPPPPLPSRRLHLLHQTRLPPRGQSARPGARAVALESAQYARWSAPQTWRSQLTCLALNLRRRARALVSPRSPPRSHMRSAQSRSRSARFSTRASTARLCPSSSVSARYGACVPGAQRTCTPCVGVTSLIADALRPRHAHMRTCLLWDAAGTRTASTPRRSPRLSRSCAARATS